MRSRRGRFKTDVLTGKFEVAPGREVFGELLLGEKNTFLTVSDESGFYFHFSDYAYINGTLFDKRKVSLFNCVRSSAAHVRGGALGEGYSYAHISPHFVVLGEKHLYPSDKLISAVHLGVDDASSLFYDFDAFGCVIDGAPFISALIESNELGRKVSTGSHPIIQYFTGKHEIIRSDTTIGKISAQHNPTYSLGGPDGVNIVNNIELMIEFDNPINFYSAMNRVEKLLLFLKIIIGRTQNVKSLNLRIEADGERSKYLNVHWSFAPTEDRPEEGQSPGPRDILLWPVEHPEEFSLVLKTWLERDSGWRHARAQVARFFGSNHYDADRLVGCANAFDLLPDSAVPSNVNLGGTIENARSKARALFKALPQSSERDSVLGALGRLGKPVLKNRIRHRAKIVSDRSNGRLPELMLVADNAVDCRNFFVHGTPGKFDFQKHLGLTFFLSDTLEFIFIASDLIDCGWGIEKWLNAGSTMTHPMAAYRVDYKSELEQLKRVINKK